MGYLKEVHGVTLLGKTPEGTCPVCATKHESYQPHNQRSLTYQYKFYDEHGRWPIWEDAMEHCPEEIKEAWREELEKIGIKTK